MRRWFFSLSANPNTIAFQLALSNRYTTTSPAPTAVRGAGATG